MLSTGDPSTLGTYKKLAKIFGEKAETFIQNKIDESPNGENEEVLAPEGQMIFILSSMMEQNETKQENDYGEQKKT